MRQRVGLLIRSYLLERGRGYPYEFWRLYSQHTTYQHIAKMFYILNKLGLIRRVGEEPSSKSSPIPRTLYEVVKERIDDPCWETPQQCLYQDLREQIREWKRRKRQQIAHSQHTTEQTPEEK